MLRQWSNSMQISARCRVGDRRRERVHARTNGARAAGEKGERMGGRRTRVSDGHVFVGVQLRDDSFRTSAVRNRFKKTCFRANAPPSRRAMFVCTRATSNN